LTVAAWSGKYSGMTDRTDTESFVNAADVTAVDGLFRIDNAWKCERCEAIFVGDYYSADHCNKTGADLTLCLACCEDANAEREQCQACGHEAVQS
jgi:hypothetical protein